MATVGERLREARQAAGVSVRALAKAVGLAPTTIYDLERGDSAGTPKLPAIAKLLKVNAYWLQTGIGQRDAAEPAVSPFETVPMGAPARVAEHKPSYADDVTVRFFPRVRASAGPGAENDHGEPLGLRFSAASMRRRGLQPERCAIIFADGDSMEPDIADGSVVMFDRSQTEIKDGRVYVIQVDGRELVKILHRRPGGQVLVQSRNDVYPPYAVSAEQDGFAVLGRVVWTARWL